MKYSVKANPSRKVDDTDEIVGGDLRVTKQMNLTIDIKEINNSSDFNTMRHTIIWALNYIDKAPLEVYGTMEYATQAIDFLKEMLKLWEEAEIKCYDPIFNMYYRKKGIPRRYEKGIPRSL